MQIQYRYLINYILLSSLLAINWPTENNAVYILNSTDEQDENLSKTHLFAFFYTVIIIIIIIIILLLCKLIVLLKRSKTIFIGESIAFVTRTIENIINISVIEYNPRKAHISRK